MLLLAAWSLNHVALKMSWLPVLAFCNISLHKEILVDLSLLDRFCLALAPAGAWVAVAADTHGWAAITGAVDGGRVSFGSQSSSLCLWESCCFLFRTNGNHALMDVEVDRIKGFTPSHQLMVSSATMKLSVFLTLGWLASFLMSGVVDPVLWFPTVFLMALVNLTS